VYLPGALPTNDIDAFHPDLMRITDHFSVTVQPFPGTVNLIM
jgi:hypothetical protein